MENGMIKIWHRRDTPTMYIDIAPSSDFVLCVVIPKIIPMEDLDVSIENLLEYSYIRPDRIEYENSIVYFTYY